MFIGILKFLYYLLISFLIAVVVFLIMRIHQKSVDVLGSSAYIYTNSKNFFEINQTDDLEYFHEPKSGVTEGSVDKWSNLEFTQKINDDTLNDRFDYSFDKPSGVFRIITLGDSHTYGALVDTEKSYPERLEEFLNQRIECKNISKFEVINLGVPGYDIRYSVERFKNRGVKYDPDLVIWLLVHNDFNEISEYMNPYMDPVRKQMMIDGERDKWINQIYYLELKKAEAKMKEEISEDILLKHYKATILMADEHFDGKILYLSPGAIDEKNKEILRDISKNEKNKWYYSLPLYKEYAFFPEPVPNKSAHPNAVGYELIAKDVSDYLLENKIVNCEKF